MLSGKEPTQYRRHQFDLQVRKTSWRRKWQPTSVFLPRKSQGQRRLVGYRPLRHVCLDMTERLNNTRNTHRNLASHTHVEGKTHAQKILEKTLNFHLRLTAKLKVSLDKCWDVLVQSPSAKTGRGIWHEFLVFFFAYGGGDHFLNFIS